MFQSQKMTRRGRGSKPVQQEQGLTPYQGTRRSFGYFKCPECKRSWQSGNSWADTSQKCLVCRISVYPFRQRELRKVKHDWIDPNKHHQSTLCGKCKELGFPCTDDEWAGKRRR